MAVQKVFVSGATGKTGQAVVAELASRQVPVRAQVHRIDPRSQALAAAGAEVVVADLFDARGLAQAMDGCASAYFCPPWHPHMIQSAVAFVVAARQAGVGTIVHLSQWLASPDNPSLATRQNWLVEELLSSQPDIGYVRLNPGFFADNYLRVMSMVAQLGILPMPIGKSRNAPPSNEDIARVAVEALIDPERHKGMTYRPTGPELLSGSDMARILGKVVGRRVHFVDMPQFMFLKAGRALGISPFELSGIRHYLAEHRRGAFEFCAPTDHVRKVTGQVPESFETIARRYASRPEAHRTFANTMRAVGEFMKIGMTPGYNLDRFDRMQQHPAPSPSVLAADDPDWKATRMR
jgi:uncharacterized protein YbjT (DUF2867 family)